MSERLEKAFQIIGDRANWEAKQRLWYLMRHDGLRRINKPFPTAADAHFPMIDMNIGDLKPFWLAQAFGGARLCDFLAMRQQLDDTTEAAADYHDFELRYRTDYRYQMETAVDTMLLRGRSILLVTVDPYDSYKIKFKAIDPQFILMPQQADDFDDADGWTYVQHLTVNQYKRNRNFNQDQDVIDAIRGRPDYAAENHKYDKMLREGVTHSTRKDEIILWHQWERTPGGFTIYTYSPMAEDKKIRAPYGCPYKVDGKVSNPFFSLTMEIKDSGWYSPRGVAELNAAFEAYATKLWNEKSDYMTFSNRPLFTSDKDLVNTGNITITPGTFLPGGITAVQMPQPPMSFDEEINFVREVSEKRARTPDFGITREDGTNPRTATENNRISGLQDVGADHNGDVFRNIRLKKIYTHTWGLMVQFQGRRLSYYVADNLKELPVQAMHDQYFVIPDGGAGTKGQRLQRATQRYMLFKGDPGIDQDELKRGVLAADDSRLIKKLLIPMNQKQQEEAYQEDVEIAVLTMGRPVPVMPGQDHATRIMELMGYLQKQAATGAAHDPVASQRIKEHLAQHFQYLQQQNPQAAKQIKAMVMQSEQGAPPSTGSTASGPASPPPNGAANGAQGQPSGNGDRKLSESITCKLSDLYPSERAQFLASIGIQAAPPQEMIQTEQMRAQIKQAGVKPKIQGTAE